MTQIQVVMEAPSDEPEEIIQWMNWGFMLTAIPIIRKFTEEMQMNLKADWIEMYNWIVIQAAILGSEIYRYLAELIKVPASSTTFYIKNFYIQRLTGMTPNNSKEFQKKMSRSVLYNFGEVFGRRYLLVMGGLQVTVSSKRRDHRDQPLTTLQSLQHPHV